MELCITESKNGEPVPPEYRFCGHDGLAFRSSRVMHGQARTLPNSNPNFNPGLNFSLVTSVAFCVLRPDTMRRETQCDEPRHFCIERAVFRPVGRATLVRFDLPP